MTDLVNNNCNTTPLIEFSSVTRISYEDTPHIDFNRSEVDEYGTVTLYYDAFINCGPEGSQGPQGAQGAAGPVGPRGPKGTGGGGGEGSVVEWTQLQSKTDDTVQIAAIKIDGVQTAVHAPKGGGGGGSSVSWDTEVANKSVGLKVDGVKKTLSLGSHTHEYLPLSGGTLSGNVNTKSLLPVGTNENIGSSAKPYDSMYANELIASEYKIVNGNNVVVAEIKYDTTTRTVYIVSADGGSINLYVNGCIYGAEHFVGKPTNFDPAGEITPVDFDFIGRIAALETAVAALQNELNEVPIFEHNEDSHTLKITPKTE